MLVSAPLDRLATNILGPFPESTGGKKFVLKVTDYFTKRVEIFFMSNHSAVTGAEVILDEVIGCDGCPYNIHSNQAKIKTAELCHLLEIHKMRTRPGNHQGNGQVEHFNQTLVSMNKPYLKGRQREWDRNLGALADAYHARPHESTQMTLNLLILHRETQLTIAVILGSRGTTTGEPVTSYGKYIDGLRDQMQRMHDVGGKYLGRNAARMKEPYDVKCSLTHYKIGDLVMYVMKRGQLDVAPKLEVTFQAPYLVLDRIRDLDYQVQLDARANKKLYTMISWSLI